VDNQEKPMQLMRGSLVGYAAERMVFLFTMMRAAETVDCEISSSALDDLDGKKGTWPDEREAQFERLRDQIERVVSDTFEQNGQPEGETIRIFSKHVKGL
jgi:Protein of unknown function (DUF1488)